MILIAHRGNIDSVKPDKENTQDYIDEAIIFGYDVEIDVRLIDNKLYLGHDTPDHEVSMGWLLDRRHELWVHTKNFSALNLLIDTDLRTFYHQKEDHTIINNCNLIWSHNLEEANSKSIIPLLDAADIFDFEKYNVYGICSDYVRLVEDSFNE